MATPISRDILNREVDARFWAQTGHKPGQRLDPNNPLDKAKIPVWNDIFRKVKAEADAGTLVTTYDRPEVAQPLADAQVANTVAALHVDAAAKASDPTTAQQHTAAAVTATQVSSQKLSEAAANQPPTVSPKLEHEAARAVAKTPPPPHAPAADHIAHAQIQNGQARNGQMLRPEEDRDPRYVPKAPREQPPAQPSKSPRERPSREVLFRETNERFWNRTQYKRGQKLDMSIAEDRKQAEIWKDILREVEREANEGRLAFTTPAPSPDGTRPPLRPMPPPGPPPLRPTPPRPLTPPSPPMPPMPSQPMPPPGPTPLRPTPPRPLTPPPLPPQPMPPPGVQQQMPPWMQRPTPPWTQQPMPPWMQRPMPGQPVTQPVPQPPPSPTPGEPSIPTEGGPPSPAEEAPAPTEPTTEGAPAEEAGMSGGTIALIVLGLVGAAGIAYAVTRKPAPAGRTVSFRPRGKSTMAATGASSSAFPASRGGRF